MLLLVLPLNIEDGKLSYPQAHAFVGKLILKAIKFETKLIIKNWLKDVAKKEGKRVALAAIKSIKALPNDESFRLAIVAALAGGNYAQAVDFTKQRSVGLMKVAAKEQWEADKRNLSENPDIVFQSFGRSAGDTVEEQWNDEDDKFTCGKNNIDIELQTVNSNTTNKQSEFKLVKTPNEELLTGRALLQRILLKRMIKNSSFKNREDAQAKASLYSRLACLGGKSKGVTAFIGGMALKGKGSMVKLEDVKGKTDEFMENIDTWAQRKLRQ